MQKRIRVAIVIAAIAALCASSAVFAFLTKADTHSAAFAVGNVAGILLDTPVSTAEGEYIQPEQVIETAPKVKNTGAGDAIVFVEMEVPVETVKTYSATGVSATATPSALFEEKSAINSDWIVYDGPSVHNGVETTVYAYKTVLAGDQDLVTNPIFNDLRVINTTSMDESSYDVKFTAKMIQAEGIKENTGSEVLVRNELESAYTALSDHGL